MTLDQSALLELLESLKLAEVVTGSVRRPRRSTKL